MSAAKNPSVKKTSIGTLKESSLHKSLKMHYMGLGGQMEHSAASYVCDAITEYGELIEIQTGSFGPLKEKAKLLCKENKLKIVFPIICKKYIELYSDKKKLIRRRKSPIKGCKWDLFNVLIYAPALPNLKNLTIELALVEMTEKRIDDGKGSWRRKGISINDRLLDEIHGSVILKNPKDYLGFIPFNAGEEFTVKDLAGRAGINSALARKTLYTMEKTGILEHAGKRSGSYLYKIKQKSKGSKKKPAPKSAPV